jgi:hypothetical protein
MSEALHQDKPSAYGGLVLRISLPGEMSAIKDSICRNVQFSKHVSSRDIKPRERDLCLFRSDSIQDSIWLCRLSTRGATGESRLIFNDPVLLGDILDNPPPPLKEELELAFAKGQSRLSPEIWKSLLDWIFLQTPELQPQLEELERMRLETAQVIEDFRERIIAEQWDATGVSMEFGGFSRSKYLPPLKREILQRGEAFVLNVGTARTLEEDILHHEIRNMPGWELFKECKGGVVRMRRSGRRHEPDHELTIINANRKPLEECLGVDLILHNSAFGSCTLVQYKRLTKSGTTWSFNLKDEQLCKQLDSIKLFKTAHCKAESANLPHEYRLGTEAFFVKFVRDEISDSQSTSLFEGWYMPVEYLELLKACKLESGVGGGIYVSENNAQRWFSNSDFAPLVASGWIGTHTKTTGLINRMINASLEGSRSLVFALARRIDE